MPSIKTYILHQSCSLSRVGESQHSTSTACVSGFLALAGCPQAITNVHEYVLKSATNSSHGRPISSLDVASELPEKHDLA